MATNEAEITVGKRVYIEFSASNGENVVWTIIGGDGQANISVDGSDLVVQGLKAGTVQIQGSFSDGSGAVTLTIYMTPGASSSGSSSEPSSPASSSEEESSASSAVESSVPDEESESQSQSQSQSSQASQSSVPNIWG